ncbi:MAG: helix-turn-helix transcriptional regulator [Fimbriimonas sp.]|nr:helix-turn-helix transcriptional regulator [Fimbriimonas sp.]
MEYGPELLKGNIQTLVLAVLEAGALHGYGISKEIERRSDDALSFGEGTVYPALKALEREGFIVGTWDNPPAGPARKMYTLTETGRREAARRRDVWERFTQTIDRVLGRRDGKVMGCA